MPQAEPFLLAMLLVSLRIVPALAFSPPFTLVRIPGTARLLLTLGIAAWLVAGHPQTTSADFAGRGGLALAGGELIIGIGLALALQLAFAALMTVGRAIDLQAGYAFAMIADPTSRSQVPLIGMLFAYAAAIIFFAADGMANLLAVWSLSLDQLPLGAAISQDAPAKLAAYFGAACILAFGAGGLVLLVLFLIDAAIALASRTLPQMNVLFLGFQVKALVTLAILPIALAGSAALFLRIVRFAFETMAQLV